MKVTSAIGFPFFTEEAHDVSSNSIRTPPTASTSLTTVVVSESLSSATGENSVSKNKNVGHW